MTEAAWGLGADPKNVSESNSFWFENAIYEIDIGFQ